jgi:hypothetical protein
MVTKGEVETADFDRVCVACGKVHGPVNARKPA